MYCFCFSSFSLSVIVVTYIVASFENRPLSFFFFFHSLVNDEKGEKDDEGETEQQNGTHK